MAQTQRKGTSRSLSAAAGMVPVSDLPLNPVIVWLMQEDGGTPGVTIARLKGAHARASCSCATFERESWCQHCLDVLSLNPKILSGLEAELGTALRQLVSGLPLATEAKLLVASQHAFAASLEKFDGERPGDIAAGNLSIFTELVSDLAVAASELEDAIGRFRRRMEAWKTIPGASAAERHPTVEANR